MATITSPRRSHLSTEYHLTWNTVSLLRVQEYRILYRANEQVSKNKNIPEVVLPLPIN